MPAFPLTCALAPCSRWRFSPSVTGALVWTQSRSTNNEGEFTLVFNAPGVDPADFGPYVVICSLPPMEEVNQPSYISSYLIAEP